MHRQLLLIFSIVVWLTSCDQVSPVTQNDPSGLSHADLDAPVPEPRIGTKHELEAMNKGSAHYNAELAACPKLGLIEWQKRIDTLKAGMFTSQVEKVLPRNSVSGSTLWAYDGIQSSDVRQTHIWALDSEFAVAVEEDMSGEDLWRKEGSPKPRLRRHANRITGRPILLRHKGVLTDGGGLARKDCWPL
jgi:hypothetical protein